MNQAPYSEQQENKQVPWAVVVIIIIAILAGVSWLMINKNETSTPVVSEPVVALPAVEPVAESEPVVELAPEINVPDVEDIIEPEPLAAPEPSLPSLDESDALILEKLPEITWRKELLKLIVTEDVIRRFVVFTDNFSQGSLSYEHSLFTLPTQKFYAQEIADSNEEQQWLWQEASAQRFTLYVDLLRAVDSGELVDFYFEIKPLIDQAYEELGYPDADFTDVLQTSITRVLDMDIPQSDIVLIRPSVMYKFQDEDLEAQDDANKLLFRIGRENLLVIKSILLEINDKLSRANDN